MLSVHNICPNSVRQFLAEFFRGFPKNEIIVAYVEMQFILVILPACSDYVNVQAHRETRLKIGTIILKGEVSD